MNTLLQDLRFALRLLRRAPAFTVTVVLTLALGIGATTAIFTLTYQVLLRSLPVEAPEQLYKAGRSVDCCVTGGLQDDWTLFSYSLYQSLRDGTPGTAGIAAVDSAAIAVTARAEGDAGTLPLSIRSVSGNYFSLLGVHAAQGRVITPDDDREGAAPVAVVSRAVWETKFHSDPALVGKTVLLTGHPFTVIGLTPAGFFGERNTGDPAGVWVPLAQEPVLDPDRKLLHYPNAHWLDILIRIQDPHAVHSVQQSVRLGLLQWIRANREPNQNETDAEIAKQTTELVAASTGINDLGQQYEKSLRLLMMIAGAVLLICCANLANLLLVRAVARSQEINVRTALGAPRSRLIRQMLVEAVVLSLIGGAAGVLIAYGGVSAMLALAMKGVEIDPLSARPSLPILAFALALSLVTGVLFGTAPAWIASRVNPANALRGANRSLGDGGALPQRMLVVLQAALSVVLLSMAGLLISSLRNLRTQDFRFQPEGRLIAFINLQAAGLQYEQLEGLYRQFDQQIATLPGVQNIAYGTYTPMAYNNWGTGLSIAGRNPNGKDNASYSLVSAHYLEAVGTRVLLGRGITEQDTATSTHVAVVNKTFVDKYLKDKNPIGVRFGEDRRLVNEYEIVGVVDDTKYGDPTQPTRPMFLRPITQITSFDAIEASVSLKEQANKGERFAHFASNLVVQYQGDPAAMANTLRRTLNNINPNIPISQLITYQEQVGNYFTRQELVVRLTTVFGLLALVLASIGLYGVTAYNVARRVPEIGLRMALGSDRAGILRLILRGAMTQTLIGLAIGVPAALLAGHFLESQLFGIKGSNPAALFGAVGLLALSALAAGIVPARRASVIEPMLALRAE